MIRQRITRFIKGDTELVRDVLQSDNSLSLKRRRSIVGLSLLGTMNAALTTARQTGIVDHLPDLPGKIFDANKVTTSSKAFDLRLPDGPVAIMAQSFIMMAATIGGKLSLRRTKVHDGILLGLVSVNALMSIQYFANMIREQKKICAYCVLATITNLSLVPFAWQEWKKGAL